MGEAVGIRGKFKTKKERFAEIQKVLIEGLSQYLEPDDYPVRWESYFEAKDDCLELEFESFGSYGRAEDYIAQNFMKEYSDVEVEFNVIVYDEEEYFEEEYYEEFYDEDEEFYEEDEE